MKTVAAAFILLQATSSLWAQSSSSFEVRPPATSAVIGAPIQIEGTAKYPDRFTLSIDLQTQATSAFAITHLDLGPLKKGNGSSSQIVRITAVPFDLGPQIFPSLTWKLIGTSGNETLKSPPVKIAVAAPAGADGQGDIRDIKGPMEPVLWPYFLLAAAIIAGAAYLAKKYWPASGPHVTPGGAIDPRPPHEIALAGLASLAGMNLNPKQYYERMTDILRIYLEGRFEIPALVLTTSDLLRQMRQAEIERNVISGIKDIFDRADLVKFAKFTPNAAEMNQDCTAAVELVKATAPKPEPALGIAKPVN